MQQHESPAASIALLPPPERAKALAAIAPTAVELAALEYEWRRFWARPKQVAPSWRWSTWLVLAGRGFGKTRTGAEWCREVAESGRCKRLHLVARTAADVRDVLVGGESGILAISPPWFRPRWEPSKRLLTWPNGAIALTYSADEPDQLRGPQCDGAWADELAAWRYPDAWDQLQFGLRLGSDPQCVVTTTPRPTPIIRALVDDATTAVTRGSTYENRGNLAPAFVQKILSKYEGTRLGRQELLAEILDDAPGALWKRDDIERARVKAAPQRGFRRVVVAVDPAASVSEDSDETGIVVVGLGFDGHAYILDDASGKYTPSEWARQVCRLYREWGADAVIGEVNNGGDRSARLCTPKTRRSGSSLFARAAASRRGPSRSRRSTSKARSTTLAYSPNSRTNSASGIRSSRRRAPTASTRPCGV